MRNKLKASGCRSIRTMARACGFHGVGPKYVRKHFDVDQVLYVQSLPKFPVGHWWFRLYDYASSERIWRAFTGELDYPYDPEYGPFARRSLWFSQYKVDYFDVDSEESLESAIQTCQRVIDDYVCPTLGALRTDDDVVQALKGNPGWSIASKEKLDEFFARWEERKKAQA